MRRNNNMTKAELKDIMNQYIITDLKGIYASAECWGWNMHKYVKDIMEYNSNEG